MNTRPEEGNQEITNERFLAAMQAVAENDTAPTRTELYRALLECTLIVPASEPLPGGDAGEWQKLQAGMRLPVVLLENEQGQVAMPAFTDTAALLAWRPQGSDYIAFHATDLMSLAQQNDTELVLINPAGPVGGALTRREMSILAEGGIPEGPDHMTFPEETQARLRHPSRQPSEALMARLNHALATTPQITSAYLVEMAIGEGEPHLVVGVHVSGAPDERAIDLTMRDLVTSVQPAMSAEDYLDFLVLQNDDITRAFEENGAEVYRQPQPRE